MIDRWINPINLIREQDVTLKCLRTPGISINIPWIKQKLNQAQIVILKSPSNIYYLNIINLMKKIKIEHPI